MTIQKELQELADKHNVDISKVVEVGKSILDDMEDKLDRRQTINTMQNITRIYNEGGSYEDVLQQV